MKNILLSAIGMNPQVLTEALYYYYKKWDPPIVFDEIWVITTTKGKKGVIDELLDKENGRFHRFCKDYDIQKAPRFDESTIIVLKDRDGAELEDVRTIQDGKSLAQDVYRTVAKLTDDLQTTLFCSIAGGRKTMGVYLSLAMQLYGRPQDSLCHVLVDEKYEKCPDFFYPTPDNFTVHRRGEGAPLNAADAKDQIDLAIIPFIRLRAHRKKTRRTKGTGAQGEQAQYEEDISKIFVEAEYALASAPILGRVILRFEKRLPLIAVGKGGNYQVVVALTVKSMAFYYWMVLQKIRCREKRTCEKCKDLSCYKTIEWMVEQADEFIEIYDQIPGHGDRDWKGQKENYMTLISEIKNYYLLPQLPEAYYETMKIDTLSKGRKGHSARYGIAGDRRLFKFEGEVPQFNARTRSAGGRL